MKVLDANVLSDYLEGRPEVEPFYEEHGGADERWILPAPTYPEALVGVEYLPFGDVDRAIDALSWGDVYDVDAASSVEASRIGVVRKGPPSTASSDASRRSARISALLSCPPTENSSTRDTERR